MPTLQNTLWCHKFPPPLGTSWGLSSRKLLCYSIILDYGNIVGDGSWAFPIRCITATTAAATELQRAWWHGPWLPQSSLSASDVMVAKTVMCLHPLLSFSPLVEHGYAEHSPFSACLALNLGNTYWRHCAYFKKRVCHKAIRKTNTWQQSTEIIHTVPFQGHRWSWGFTV